MNPARNLIALWRRAGRLDAPEAPASTALRRHFAIGPIVWLLMFALCAIGAVRAAAQEAEDVAGIAIADVKRDAPVHFEKEILPILRRNCLACHNEKDAESDLVLETPQTIRAGGESGAAAVPGDSGASLLLELASHRDDPTMPPDDNEVGARNLSPDELGLIRLWIDQGVQGEVTADGAQPSWQPLPAAVASIYATAMTSHGDYVAAGRGNRIFLYHVPTKRPVTELVDPVLGGNDPGTGQRAAHRDAVQALAFASDNRRLASGGYRTAKIWHRREARVQAELTGVEQPISALAASPDGKWIAVGETGGKMRLYDLTEAKLARAWDGHAGRVTALQFSADSGRLASAGEDKTVRVANVADDAQLVTLQMPDAIGAIAFVADGQQIATGGADKVIRIWDLAGQPPAQAADAAAAAEAPPAAEGQPPNENAQDANAAADQPAAPPKPLRELQGHGGPITGLAAFGEGNSQLVSSSIDGTLRVWKVADGQQIRQLNHGGPVAGLAVSPDGGQFLSASDNKVVKLWKAADGQQIAELKTGDRARRRAADATRAVELAGLVRNNANKDRDEANNQKKTEEENAKKVAEARKKADEELQKKNEAVKKPVADKQAADTVLEQAKPVLAAAEEAKLKADETNKQADEALKKAQAEVAAAGDNAEVKQAAEAKVKTAQEAKNAANQARQTAEQKLNEAKAAAKKAEDEVKRLDGPAKKAIDEQTAARRTQETAVRSVERSAESIKRATAKAEAAALAAQKEEEAVKAAQASMEQSKKEAADAERPLRAVAFAPDGNAFALADDRGQVHVCADRSGAVLDLLPAAGDQPTVALAYTAQGRLVRAGPGTTLKVWETGEWELQRTIGSDELPDLLVDRVTALAFSPDGKLLATGGGEASRSGELKLWNTETGELVREIKDAHSDTVLAIDFSQDGKYVASGAADRFMKVFQVADGQLVKSFEGHSHHVLAVGWRADGRLLATGGADSVVKVWDFKSGTQQRTIDGFKKEVTGLRFLGTSDNFVVSSGNRSVSTRNSGGGGGPGFGGATDFVYAVCASADGKTVAAGGQDGILRVWQSNGQTLVNFDPPPAPVDKASAEDKQASAG